jgi:hypothetical protein
VLPITIPFHKGPGIMCHQHDREKAKSTMQML